MIGKNRMSPSKLVNQTFIALHHHQRFEPKRNSNAAFLRSAGTWVRHDPLCPSRESQVILSSHTFFVILGKEWWIVQIRYWSWPGFFPTLNRYWIWSAFFFESLFDIRFGMIFLDIWFNLEFFQYRFVIGFNQCWIIDIWR